ncbi:MAG: 3-dehydroquinate synthase [Pseudomonadota bacterium]|nr:3-dehydroquinate synthase [Pseudomonadota bacterium]QKK06027.1 MAG: 3-dehydroquinate synthase [Pseudomonadota bacterium]
MGIHETVTVKAASGSYPVHIGSGLYGQLAELLPPAAGRGILMTDENVAALYQDQVLAALKQAGWDMIAVYAVTPGEDSKSFANVEKIAQDILTKAIDRRTTIFALGGGVVGDLAGFIAAILLRGIGFVQLPTTLLAQVDSSVGGKTGINTAAGKNLIGAFYQPDAVVIDTDTLKTLPERELKAGYAETAKYGLIHDSAFWDWLQENGAAVLALDNDAVCHAVARSCAIKAEIVALDEKETDDLRALLNFGHTFGHALERAAGYDDRLRHGEAVAIGMVMAAELSEAMGLCPTGTAEDVISHFQKLGIPVRPPFSVAAAEMMDYMRYDKKNRDGKMRFVLLWETGRAFVGDGVSADTVRNILHTAFAGIKKV